MILEFSRTAALLGILLAASLTFAGANAAGADDATQTEAEALAKQLNNPIASLISVPLQFNYDGNIGPAENGERAFVNIQPVIPVGIGDGWNLISRTILPVTWQDDIFPGAGSQFGLGDVTQSLFFSPVEPAFGSIVWGAGPVLLLPTATDKLLGAEKWGAGPTAVALIQSGPWTVGMLANHIWSYAGDDGRADVSSTFLQPFFAYTTPTAWTFTFTTESAYNWKTDDWAVPVNALVSKMVAIGGQRVQIGAGARYWIDSAAGGPEGFGARFQITLLFPR